MFFLRFSAVPYAFLVVALCAGACSLVVDNKAEQCSSAADCARFPNATCDMTTATCKLVADPDQISSGITAPVEAGAPATRPSGAASDAAPPVRAVSDAGSLPDAEAGCGAGADQLYLNACTNARCRPFDNHRLRKWTVDGGLPPLPLPREAGVEVH